MEPTLPCEDNYEHIISVKIQSLPTKECYLNDEYDGFEEVSLTDTSTSDFSRRSSISSNSSVTSNSSQSDSTSYLYQQLSKSDEDIYQLKTSYSRQKKVKFYEPVVTAVKEINRPTLVEKCVLYYTDEDMLKFREEYRELLRKTVITEAPSSLLSMFTNILFHDDQLCLENDLCRCLTSVLSIANSFNVRLEETPSYQTKNKQKKKSRKKHSSKSSKSLPSEQKPMTDIKVDADIISDVNLYDMMYMY